ncbi:stage III sporulation protein AF [Paenibacillus roseipurpureus]|uniref:Stage III sporulation protein AF n=1 Tax=Paenibacillus roseopurpureus TaxID=2918901 RepID=A0AA96RIA3_9BACL|nr:stage III sporulation protein AF [Paenibacillus sp. MBLB1832]WNR42560.1 stage III sporulation protein AF [Paenibacillus sp. MBLB1832]
MDWLAGWLKTVIMVIMLATFVDLLLPSNTMQRYVKTVLSLFILLTLLTPVLQLFKKDWDIDKLLSQAEKSQNERTMLASGGGNATSIPTLSDIKNSARKMQDADGKKTVELVQRQLEGLMKEDLQKQTKWPVQKVQVQVQLDNNGKPAISNVKVTLDDIEARKQSATQAKSIAAMEPIKPVDPVKIGSIPTSHKQQSIGSNEATGDQPAKISQQEVDQLKQGLARNWLVDPDLIEIGVEQSKGRMAR